jgi:hypothetical protein
MAGGSCEANTGASPNRSILRSASRKQEMQKATFRWPWAEGRTKTAGCHEDSRPSDAALPK